LQGASRIRKDAEDTDQRLPAFRYPSLSSVPGFLAVLIGEADVAAERTAGTTPGLSFPEPVSRFT